MSNQPAQTYATHRRYVPLFHFVLAAFLVAYLAWTVRHVILWPTPQHAVDLMMAVALLLLYWFVRSFPVGVQDRVIRLEETLRYQRVLPADLQARAGELTLRQIVGLRFASDAELPALVRRALDEKLGMQDIKKAVQEWRGDHLRV